MLHSTGFVAASDEMICLHPHQAVCRNNFPTTTCLRPGPAIMPTPSGKSLPEIQSDNDQLRPERTTYTDLVAKPVAMNHAIFIHQSSPNNTIPCTTQSSTTSPVIRPAALPKSSAKKQGWFAFSAASLQAAQISCAPSKSGTSWSQS